jgi:transcriptional regulator with XRE-family HTH domain
MNAALHQSMTRAGLSPAAFAARVGVDPRTVGRWLGGRVPHPRHRVRVARVLAQDEGMLWSGLVKRGHDREIVGAWPTRSAVPRTLWTDLVSRARERIWLAGYTSYFLWTEVPGVQDVLPAKTSAGVDVRFLLGDKKSPTTATREQLEASALSVSSRISLTLSELERIDPGPAVRFSDRHIAMSVWVFDDDLLVATHLADRLGHASPTLHLRRREPGGLFDQYAAHVERLWASASGQSGGANN